MQKFQTKLKELWEKIKGFFQKLNKKTRILLGVCLVVILAAVILLTLRMNKKEYAVLCTDLSANDISTVVQFLGENGVTDYKIQNDTILVPAGRETQLQVQLMTTNRVDNAYLYPYYTDHSGGINSQIQDERAWLISIEQKLAAVVRQFDGVQDATVSIAPGTERLYVLQDSASPSSAAVTITPYGSQPLKNEVVAAIRDIVKHSVQELAIENVSIKDIYGNPYSDNSTLAQSGQATALKLEHEERINNNVRSQILQTLGPIYGYENVSVGVISTVEVSRKYRDSTFYNQPEGSVKGGGLVSEDHLFQEVIRDGSQPTGGTVGTTSNSDIPIQPDLNSSLTGDEDYAGNQVDRYHNIDTTNEQEEILEKREEREEELENLNRAYEELIEWDVGCAKGRYNPERFKERLNKKELDDLYYTYDVNQAGSYIRKSYQEFRSRYLAEYEKSGGKINIKSLFMSALNNENQGIHDFCKVLFGKTKGTSIEPL